MLPKEKRLTSPDFKTVLKNGRGIQGTLLSLKYLTSDKGAFSFVVPKSVAKTATARNTLRRRGYAALGVIEKPYSALFFFKKGAEKANMAVLKEEIHFLLLKAGII